MHTTLTDESKMSARPFDPGTHVEDVIVLSQGCIFGSLPARELGYVIDLLDLVEMPAGALVLVEGDSTAHMYFVLDGVARVEHGGILFERRKRGGHFGEQALIGFPTAGSTVLAETPLRLVRLSRAQFESLAVTHPAAALDLTKAIAASLATDLMRATEDRSVSS